MALDLPEFDLPTNATSADEGNVKSVSLAAVMKKAALIVETQRQLIEVLNNQVVDLSMMSKIELGDDVIAEIKRLETKLKDYESNI
jgi:hypothetical protein